MIKDLKNETFDNRIASSLALLPSRPPSSVNRPPWVIQYHVLKALFQRELRERVGYRIQTFLTAIIDPLFPLLGFYFVSLFMKRQGVMGIPLPLFLVTGIFTWLTMRKIIQSTSSALRANIPLMSYRYVKPLDPVMVRSLIETILFLGTMVFILVLLAYFGYDARIKNPVMIAFLYFLVPLFGFALGLLFLQLVTYFSWTKKLLNILYRFLLLGSCIAFSLHEVPSIYRSFFLLNPIVHFMELIRTEWFDYYIQPEGVSLSYVVLSTIVLLYFGLALFRKNQQRLLELTLQSIQGE
jgi:capsular polysaccharide transport system permease protein